MLGISVKEARKHLSELLDRVEGGEKIDILRRGKKVACLVPGAQKKASVPDLSDFRLSLRTKGKSLVKVLLDLREKERF